jgi:hypothetical protein
MNRAERNTFKDKLIRTIYVPTINDNAKDKNEKSKAPAKDKAGAAKIDNFVKIIQNSLPVASYDTF